jgi:hypothetical protein
LVANGYLVRNLNFQVPSDGYNGFDYVSTCVFNNFATTFGEFLFMSLLWQIEIMSRCNFVS